MRPEEIRALGELGGDTLAGVAAQAQGVHEGISHRVFAAVGPAGMVVRVMHDAIARGVYQAVRGGLRSFARGGASAARAMQGADAPSIERTSTGRVALGALNGIYGDTLQRRGSPLALGTTIRLPNGGAPRGRETHGARDVRDARDVQIGREALALAFPDASPRLAVFLHGLCETEDAWRLGDRRHVPYGAALQTELGYTPLYVRYNSGRHISHSGRELAELLARVSENWPVEVQEIALIGHSMGGLVARSACHYGDGSEWCSKVRHLFTLGAPHRGAPLERLANVAGAGLGMLPETRVIASTLNSRSAGIKDLRFGYLLDEDWLAQEPDALLRNTGKEVPFLSTANHYFVCATLSREPHAPVGRMIGDLLILRESAWDHSPHGERMRFPVDHYRHFGGANHLDLLNHPAIYAQIHRWLSGRRALAAGGVGDRRPLFA